jgi:hypothetical protein
MEPPGIAPTLTRQKQCAFCRTRRNVEVSHIDGHETCISARQSLFSRFESEGLFWFPGRPDERFSGHLKTDGRHTELTMSATPAGIEILKNLGARKRITHDV